jgi:predicted ATPase/DNA-binding SARP family transcriptional activator
MSQLDIHLFGSPRISYNGEAIEIDTRKAVAMLAYLAVTGQRHSRDSLAALLWPEYDHRRGRAALRRTLSALKSAVSGFGLDIERDSLGIDWSAEIWVDIRQFADRVGQIADHAHSGSEYCPACLAPLSQAIDLYKGDFMAGFSLRDSVVFDDWQYLQSESLRRQLSFALQGVVHCHQSEGRFPEAINSGIRLLDLDPLHEPAHRQLMTLYALDGQRPAALKQYRDCVAILDKELGVPPLPETNALYEQILSGEVIGRVALDEPERRGKRPGPDRYQSATVPDFAKSDDAPMTAAYPMVGREAQWHSLMKWYESSGSQGRLLVIEGEPGIGKTRLARSFVDFARNKGATVAAVQCYQGEESLSYTPFAEILSGAFRSWAETHQLDALPEHWLAEVSRLVPELTVKHGDQTLTAPLDSPGAQRRFFEGVLQILGILLGNERPGVLFIDDIHWADESSLDLLSYIVRRLANWPLFVLVTWREEEFPARQRLRQMLAHAHREGLAEHLALDRLDEVAVGDLLQLVYGSADVDSDAASRLHQESEGLPFFLVEFLSALAKSDGGLQPAENILAPGNSRMTTPLPMPDSVRFLLRSRLNTVTQSAQQLMQSAAVIGRSFGFEILLDTSGRGDEEAVIALEELLALGLVIEQQAEGQPINGSGRTDSLLQFPQKISPIFDFSHEKLRTLVYEDMSLARRRLLHRRAAQALVNNRHGLIAGESFRSAQVAHHYQLAGNDGEAARYYKEAGDSDRDLYANSEALAHYRSSLALGFDDPPSLQEAIGDLLTLTGDYEGALANYETAAAQVDPVEQSSQLARLEMKLGGVYHRRGDWNLAASHYKQGYDRVDDPGQQARLLTDWSLTAHHGGDLVLAQELAEKAFGQAKAAGDQQALAQAHNVLGILANSKGDYQDASQQLEESLVLAASVDNAVIKIAALNNLSLARRSAGQPEQALELVEQALNLCKELGDRHRQAALHNNLADLLHEIGCLDGAMDHLKQAAAIYSDIGGEVGQWRPEIWMLTEW